MVLFFSFLCVYLVVLFLVETLHNRVLHVAVDVARAQSLTEAEDTLNDAQLRGRRVQPRHGEPVIHHHARADDVAPPVDGPGDEGHLQQARQLVLVLYARLGVHQPALVAEAHVAADEDVVRHRLPEHLDAQHVSHNLLGLALKVRVDESDVVVCDDDVAQGREALLYPLYPDLIWQAVPKVLEFLIGCAGGDEKTLAVAGDLSETIFPAPM